MLNYVQGDQKVSVHLTYVL